MTVINTVWCWTATGKKLIALFNCKIITEWKASILDKYIFCYVNMNGLGDVSVLWYWIMYKMYNTFV